MTAAVPASDLLADNDLLQSVLEASLTALNLLRPLYGPAGELVDFSLDYLNPAGQRMVGLPARPGGSVGTHFPHAQANGLLAFYRRVFETGEAGQFDFHYQTADIDSFFLVAARRSGEVLVASILDSTYHHDRPALEATLRQSQAREQAAREAAERERNLLEAVLAQAPVAIGLFQGNDQVVRQANAHLCALWGYPPAQVVGRPLLEGVPELRGQGFTERMAEVARTGVPFRGQEAPVQLLQPNDRLATHYFNFVYQPLHDAQGGLLGVLDIAIDVTEQVLARHQVQALNEELAVTNAELAASNEEFLVNNAALATAQLQLQQLNQELEARVAERTQAAWQAQAEAEQQRRQLERLFQQVPAAICILAGPELVYELVNPCYQQLFPGRRLQGRPLLAALPELAGQPVWHSLRRVYDTGQSHEELEMLIPIARHEGGPLEDFYFHYIQQARYNEQGRIDGLVVFALDITDQTRTRRQAAALQAEVLATAQAQAQEREFFYRVFEQTPAAIAFLRGPEHRLAYFNPAYQQLFPERLLHGRTVAESQPESVEQGFVALLDHVYQTGETYRGTELPLRVASPSGGGVGKVIYFNFTYQAYQENGHTIGLSVFAYDVTEQVRGRQQRAAAQAQLQAVFEQAPVAIGLFEGAEYVVRVANASLSALWNRTPAQVLGQPLFEVVPEAADQGFRGLLDGVRRTGTPFVAYERPIVLNRYGRPEKMYFNFVYQPIRGAEEGESVVAVVATDVSQQVAARQQVALANSELQTANQQLTRTNADLDNFIYTASHDLKAPITNIEGLLTALQEQLPPAVQRDELVQPLLRMMHDAVDRFRKTIGHLTDISKLQQAHTQPTEAVDLAALVEDIRLDLAPALAAAGTHLVVDVAACPTLSFAPKNLRSILYNLLSNAIKYADPARPPVVQLRAARAAGTVVLEVEDNGLGLTEAQQRKLFIMFKRLHSHVEGSGVGLYMVKKIVENAGGSITVQSQPGAGSTFTVRLPG